VDRKRSLIIIAVIIGAIMVFALFLNLLPFTKLISPTSPTSKPIFSVALSPLKQTVYVFPNQTKFLGGFYPTFYLTIIGNATYPCGVVIWGGLPTDYNQPFAVNSNFGSYDGPKSVNGNSKTFILNVLTHQINGTATYYVSVTDNLGNSFNSNKVQVVFKVRK
jgi:hypothetical protein